MTSFATALQTLNGGDAATATMGAESLRSRDGMGADGFDRQKNHPLADARGSECGPQAGCAHFTLLAELP